MNNDKMRIAMLGHKRIPSREGGVEIVVGELACRMAQRGHSVTVYNRKGNHVSGKQYTVKGLKTYKEVKIKEVFTINRRGLAAMTSSVFGAVRAALGLYDVIHFHAEGPCAMMWLPKLFGKRVIATIHGLDWQRAKWSGLATRYLKFGEKMAVRCADEIIVLSSNVQDYFMEKYNRKTVFIPNGIEKPVNKPIDIIGTQWGLKKDEYILFLGRLVPEKGLQYLIEAFKMLKTDKKLVIAGGSSDTWQFAREMRELASSDDRIIFTGFVQGDILEELYSNAYIYCMPSDLEGMPISLLEAMSYGNCCLTSDIPECTEVTGDKAVSFKKGDVSDLYNQLQMLCEKPETVRSYKDEASDYVCDKYNWDDIVDMTLELYKL